MLMVTTWISAISIATAALVSAINLIVMGTLTRAIHEHAQRAAELEVLRRNSDQWQRLNLAFIESPRLQRVLDSRELESPEDEDIRRNLLFYMLNTLHEIYEAKNASLLNPDVAMRLMKGQTEMLKPHFEAVDTLISLRRGYDADFCAFVRAQLGDHLTSSAPNA